MLMNKNRFGWKVSWKIDTDDESVKRIENISFIHEFDKIAEREL